MDSRNRNTEKCNLPVEEVAALKRLIKLQKERKIIIKACDKGAGIIILNFEDYMKACYEHLLASLPNQTEAEEPTMYYKAENEFAVEHASKKIKATIKEALEDNIITKEEFKAMSPEGKSAAKFY